MHTQACTHTHTHAHTHICTNTHTHAQIHAYIYIHRHTHTQICTHTCISYCIEKNASSDGQIENEKIGVLVQISSNSQANRRANKLFGSDKIIFNQYLIWIIGFQN